MNTSNQDRQDAIDSYAKDAKFWHNQFTRYRCTFAEDYCRGAIAIVYELKLSTPRGLERDGLIQESLLPSGESLALLVFHHKTSDLINLQLRCQQPVLVRDVELVKLVEGFALPSLVRLYSVQEFVRDTDEGAEFQSVVNKSFQLSPIWIYRESGPVFVFGGTVGCRDSIPNIVKSALEVVQGVPEDESESVWQGLNRDDLYKLVAGFRISLDGDSVSTIITLEETSRLRVEITDVLVGPFNL